MPKLLGVKPSNRREKKVMAIFYTDDKKIKIIHFGSPDYKDYTSFSESERDERKERYLKRHEKRELKLWEEEPMSPASLSRWILWNKPSFRESVKDFKKRFNL